MTRVHVWGAGGYAAAELVRLVLAHPTLEIGLLESRSHVGERIGDSFPQLRRLGKRFDHPGSIIERAEGSDIVVTAGAHGEAVAIVPEFLERGIRIIDLSADYRFDKRAAYGLPEWHRGAIACAMLVANPGCYPTATSLALLPLAAIGSPEIITIDAKSGITGAGRNPTVESLFAEVAADIRPYGLNGHRHQPEIERNLRAAGMTPEVAFTPHVVPLARGMLIDAYAVFNERVDAAAVETAFADAYRGSPFVRLLERDETPSVRAVTGTNHAELRVDVSGRIVRSICAIDNLGKGAAGQAVQNLNIMLGFSEDLGLRDRAIVA